MTTISFSVEDDIKRDINAWAKRAKKSKSDLFRDIITTYRFNEQLNSFTNKTETKLQELGIDNEEDLYKYLESNETYKSRVRQQRVSGGNQK